MLRDAGWVRSDSGGDRRTSVARRERVLGANGDYGGVFGCKAIHLSGGAFSFLMKDAMTRAPVVKFPSVKRAARAMFYLQDPANFERLSLIFSK